VSILTDLRYEASDKLIPFQATLELTYRCNERCGHCYLATYNDQEDGRPPLTLEEWKKVLDQLKDAGAFVLVLIGGEAMMHPHFWEISEYAARKGFALSLITNGLLVDDRTADRMKDLNFYQISVSLYSLNPLIHDGMTKRKGSHFKTVTAVQKLKQRNLDVIINCLLTNQNIDICFDLEDWAKTFNVRVQFDPLVTAKSDGSLDSTVTRATPEQLLNYYRTLKERNRTPAPVISQKADPVCNQGRGKCAVNVYGDLLTCLEVRDALGNFRENTFKEMWNSPKANKMRSLFNADLNFDTDSDEGQHCDHCPGMAQAETGDMRNAVPFLMEIAKIKKQVATESKI
jgi:MoaA/NifB/PqqE/SkfB family radical SAM enzyme